MLKDRIPKVCSPVSCLPLAWTLAWMLLQEGKEWKGTKPFHVHISRLTQGFRYLDEILLLTKAELGCLHYLFGNQHRSQGGVYGLVGDISQVEWGKGSLAMLNISPHNRIKCFSGKRRTDLCPWLHELSRGKEGQPLPKMRWRLIWSLHGTRKKCCS